MMDDDAHKLEMTKIGRAVREQCGLSERELADAAPGISLAGIVAIEAGERDLDCE